MIRNISDTLAVENARRAPRSNGIVDGSHLIEGMGFSERACAAAGQQAGAANPAGAEISAVGKMRDPGSR